MRAKVLLSLSVSAEFTETEFTTTEFTGSLQGT